MDAWVLIYSKFPLWCKFKFHKILNILLWIEDCSVSGVLKCICKMNYVYCFHFYGDHWIKLIQTWTMRDPGKLHLAELSFSFLPLYCGCLTQIQYTTNNIFNNSIRSNKLSFELVANIYILTYSPNLIVIEDWLNPHKTPVYGCQYLCSFEM